MVYKTSDGRKWREVSGEEWDNCGELSRNILYGSFDSSNQIGIIFVVEVK